MLRHKIFSVALLLISTSVLAHDHPWPPPIAAINITDIGLRVSPVTCSGTADVYVDRKSYGTVSSWVEGNHLQITNVSSKVITKMLVEVRWQDIHGEGTSVIRYDLDFTDPTDSIQPGGSWKTSGAHAPGPKVNHKAADFDSLPANAPKLRAHALSVTFSDGTSYSESPDDKERPW
jgi:hypothetical protein